MGRSRFVDVGFAHWRASEPSRLRDEDFAHWSFGGECPQPQWDEPAHSDFAEPLSTADLDRFVERLARGRVRDARDMAERVRVARTAAAPPQDPRKLADLIADVLGGLLGERARLAFDQSPEPGRQLARFAEGHWDPLLHPRDARGRFIPRGSPQALATAHEALGRLRRAGRATPENVREALEHLSILTVKQLRELKRQHGLKASGKLKADLARQIAERLPGSHYQSRPWESGDVQHGQVYNAPLGELHADPARFQFKLNVDPVHGVTEELRQVQSWNPDFAGVISVWRDPADGKTYVVNGHHRYELASRLGVEDLAVRYVEAQSAKEARAVGALINIAEGRGTSIDAAKFMRDSGAGPEALAAHGVSLKGRLAEEAVVLTRLGDRAFEKVTAGTLELPKALAVARHLADPELQNYLIDRLERREEEGKDFSPRIIEEMARALAMTPRVTDSGGLFGDEQVPLIEERAEIAAHVRAELAKEANDWAAVASKRRAGRVTEAGNVLDVEKNRELAQAAGRVQNVYDSLVNRKGQVADAVNAAAEALAAAKGKKGRDDAKRKALEAVRHAVFREAGVGEAEPPGAGPGGSGGAAPRPAEPAAQPAAPADAPGGGPAAGGLSPIPLGDPQALADAVHKAARSVPAAIGGHINPGDLPEHESHKPLVSDVYDRVKDRLGGASLEQFKSALLAAHQSGRVNLARNDMPQGVPDSPAGNGHERSARSEIVHPSGAASYHTIDTNGPAARGRAGGNPAAAGGPVPAPASASPPSPSRAPTFDRSAVERDILRLNDQLTDRRLALAPPIPRLHDELAKAHPGLTEADFHALLHDMQQRDLLTLQTANDPRLITSDHPEARPQPGEQRYPMARFPRGGRHGQMLGWIQTRPGAAERLAAARSTGPSAASSPHAEALAGIPQGTAGHVGGWLVRRQGPATWRIDTDKGHVSGGVEAITEHLERDRKERDLDRTRRQAALDRAAAHTEPEPFTDQARFVREQEALGRLPEGARVVSLDPSTHGRLGTVGREEGQLRIRLDGDPAPVRHTHVEPLDARQSWRTPSAVQAAATEQQGRLFTPTEPAPAAPRATPPALPERTPPRPARAEESDDFFQVSPEQGGLFR